MAPAPDHAYDPEARLFDVGPPVKPPHATPSASDIARASLPLYQIVVGTRVDFIRARSEDDAWWAWRSRRRATASNVRRDEVTVRRLVHADIVRILNIDPALARRLGSL